MGPPEILKFNTDTVAGYEPYGDCTDFLVDNSNKFLIAVFPQTNKIVILDLASGELVKKIEQPNLNLEQVFLDETGCFLSTLNNTKNQISIYMFEWEYEVKEPLKVVKVEKT